MLRAQNELNQRIVHFDLKPANILFDENMVVKVADFGLSKISAGDVTHMEHTSAGAGTYYYQPPECFSPDAQISNKVDVWALGVIFYQMVYGRRPFDSGISQDEMMRTMVCPGAAVAVAVCVCVWWCVCGGGGE